MKISFWYIKYNINIIISWLFRFLVFLLNCKKTRNIYKPRNRGTKVYGFHASRGWFLSDANNIRVARYCVVFCNPARWPYFNNELLGQTINGPNKQSRFMLRIKTTRDRLHNLGATEDFSIPKNCRLFKSCRFHKFNCIFLIKL